MPGCPDARMPGCPDARTPGRPDAGTPGWTGFSGMDAGCGMRVGDDRWGSQVATCNGRALFLNTDPRMKRVAFWSAAVLFAASAALLGASTPPAGSAPLLPIPESRRPLPTLGLVMAACSRPTQGSPRRRTGRRRRALA